MYDPQCRAKGPEIKAHDGLKFWVDTRVDINYGSVRLRCAGQN